MPYLINNAFPIYSDVDGDPLEDGYIHIGVAGLSPISNPKQAYWDSALTIPADNIRTKGGYASNNGSPGRLYVDGNYSILVQDKKQNLVYTNTNALDYFTVGTGDNVLVIDTYAQLTGATGLREGQIIQLLGYYNVGDKGAWKWIVDTNNNPWSADLGDGLYANPVDEEGISPESLGARGSGESTDNDTIYLKYLFNNFENVSLLSLYYLTTQGTVNDGQGSGAYAVLVDTITNLKITFKPEARLVFDRSDTEMPNLIKFKSCENIEINNPSTQQLTTALRLSKNGYQGATIYCYDCENVTINGGVTRNNLYHVQTYLCNNVTVDGGVGINDYYSATDTADENAGSSFVLFFSTKNSIVMNTQSYGNWWDGQISLFGACENCKVVNNIVIGIPYDQFDSPDFSTFRIQQGITVDQGPSQCEVSGNTVDGFFYGIDQKADTQNNNIHDNTILRCKISIAERKGEAPLADASVEGKIQNNIILLSSDVLGAAQTAAQNPIREYEQHGIFSETRLSCDITGNKIMMDLNNSGSYSTYKIAGIFADFDESLGGEYRPSRVIKDNNVVFQLGQDATVRSAPVDSVAYVLDDATRLVVSDNSYSLSTSVTTYAFRFISDITVGYFSSNKGLVNQGVEFLLDATDSISNCVFASQNKPDNLDCYSFDERGIIRTYGVIPGTFTAAVLTSMFEVTTSTDDDTSIKLSIIAEPSGGLVWEGIVYLYFNIDGSVLNSVVTPLYQRNVNNIVVTRTANFVAVVQINPGVTVSSGLKVVMETLNSSDDISIKNI